jgi:PqqD family protein of HPr-rel-A system
MRQGPETHDPEAAEPILPPDDGAPSGPMLDEEIPISLPPDYVPVRSADVLELDMEDGLIVYDRGSSLVHHLNPSARIVWQLCDGSTSIGELASDIAAQYGLGGEQVTAQVSGLFAELEALGLIEEADRD